MKPRHGGKTKPTSNRSLNSNQPVLAQIPLHINLAELLRISHFETVIEFLKKLDFKLLLQFSGSSKTFSIHRRPLTKHLPSIDIGVGRKSLYRATYRQDKCCHPAGNSSSLLPVEKVIFSPLVPSEEIPPKFAPADSPKIPSP